MALISSFFDYILSSCQQYQKVVSVDLKEECVGLTIAYVLTVPVFAQIAKQQLFLFVSAFLVVGTKIDKLSPLKYIHMPF